jgi:triosephosphate isomerase
MNMLIANWKMAPDTLLEALRLAKSTATITKKYKKSLTVIAAVPALYIPPIVSKERSLVVAAQDVAPVSTVAATGSIGANLLKGNKVSYCIVGHSECRSAGDTNEIVRAKIERLIEKKITPIICVGEKVRDEQGWYLSGIKDQIESALSAVPKAMVKRIIIAYEPVWAIGSHAVREATPVECQEMMLFIRKILADLSDHKTATQVSILYGGSVSEDNARAFLDDGGADGLLVGRVSLDAKRFAKLAERIS